MSISTAGPGPSGGEPRQEFGLLGVIDRHFAAENAHEIPATLATYTGTTWPTRPVRFAVSTRPRGCARASAIPDLRLEGIVRFAAGDHVVDESLANGHVHGSFLGSTGWAPVSFRMLHVFDLHDGLISREQAWFDTASVPRQIAEHRSL